MTSDLNTEYADLITIKIEEIHSERIEKTAPTPHLEGVNRHPTAQNHCVAESAEKFTTTKKWSAT